MPLDRIFPKFIPPKEGVFPTFIIAYAPGEIFSGVMLKHNVIFLPMDSLIFADVLGTSY